nr:PREDICTED: ovalbumin-related protein X-like isoform X2 [Megachile rotundata]
MLEHGAGGKTKAQFKKVLHLPSSERSGAAGYESLIKNLKDVHANEIKFGSKLFTASNAPIKDSYKKMLKKHFDAETQPLNFNNAAASANAINAWVQSVAKDHPGHLANLIAPSDLGPETKMVLVNPIYFKGYWMNGFNVNNTRQRPFKLNNSKEKNVPTMSKTSLLKYGEMPNGKATYVVLPLRANELSMVVFLPKAVDGLAELEKELPKASISSYINAAQDRMVAVQLPRFHFHNKINLKKPLMSLGLTDAFNQNANFSGISNQKLHVSRIVQNTHVEVDEEGGDIDVGTGDITSRIALPPAVNFDVNHPFHVVIVKNNKSGSNRSSHVTLYSGHVVNP